MSGRHETGKLKMNLIAQVDRLIVQLKDLEEFRSDMEAEEYSKARHETLDQLKDFETQLGRFNDGNLSLVDNVRSTQMAIQAAVSEAFRTPEIIRLFAQREPEQLRERLQQLSCDVKLARVSADSYTTQRLEVLSALKRLGEALSPEESAYLHDNSPDSLRRFNDDHEFDMSVQSVASLVQSGLKHSL